MSDGTITGMSCEKMVGGGGGGGGAVQRLDKTLWYRAYTWLLCMLGPS